MIRLALWCAVAAMVVAAQESRPASAPTLEQIVERANHQNPYYSALGLKALRTRGADGLAALETFVERRSLHALAPLVVEWLGEVEDARARRLLLRALAAVEFPWRPQAARALAGAPRKDDLAAFRGLSRDRLAAVREPALQALSALAAKDAGIRGEVTEALVAALTDDAYEPRLAAAEGLQALGDDRALRPLVDALAVERRFFDLDFGVLARRRAWTALAPIAGDVGYDPNLGRVRNAAALAAVAGRLGARLGTSGAARAADADADDAILGLEIRSCRAGDAWVRITSGSEIVLGHYDLERRPLPPGRAAALRRLVEGARDGSPETRLAAGAYLGRPGCDFEKWYLPAELALVKVTVGLEGRPPTLEALFREIVATVKDVFGEDVASAMSDRAAPFGKSSEDED